MTPTNPAPKSEVEQVDLDAIEKLAKAATPGPWHAPKFIGQAQMFIYRSWGAQTQVARTLSTMKPDAAFIAAANPSTVQALIAEAREGRRLKSALEFVARKTVKNPVEGEGYPTFVEGLLATAREIGWKEGSDV